MIRTAALVEELRAVGIAAPARPVPPFEHLPANPTSQECELDRACQALCVTGIEEVVALHYRYFLAGDQTSKN